MADEQRFKSAYAQSQKLMPEVIAKLEAFLGCEVTMACRNDDMMFATDLIAKDDRHTHIAVRIRTYQYLLSWPNDFTVRDGLPSGAKTELTKLLEGHGDLMFYGFEAEDRASVIRWKLIDLHVWREFLIMSGFKAGVPHALAKEIVNAKDGTHGLAFNITRFPDRMVIGQSDPLHVQEENNKTQSMQPTIAQPPTAGHYRSTCPVHAAMVAASRAEENRHGAT